MKYLVSLFLSLVIIGCEFKADISSALYVEGPPQISLLKEPDVLIGNSTAEFTWVLEYIKTLEVTLNSADVVVTPSGSVTGCTARVSKQGLRANIVVSGCQGDGSFSLAVKAGSARDSLGALAPEYISPLSIQIDNTPPVGILSKVPKYYDGNLTYLYSYFWSVEYQGAEEISLRSQDIRVVGNGYGCEPVVSGSGTTRLIMLYGCAGVGGDVSIELPSAVARDRAGNVSLKLEDPVPTPLENSQYQVYFAEGNKEIARQSGTQRVRFDLKVSSPSTVPIEVKYIVGPRTNALPGSYTLTSGTLVIPAGQTQASIEYEVNTQLVGTGRRVIQLGVQDLQPGLSYHIRKHVSQHIIEEENQVSFQEVAVGTEGNACGIEKSTGQLYCWGNNQGGRVGHHLGLSEYFEPVKVDTGNAYKSISVGSWHTCGLLQSNHELRCWGDNGNGRLGDQTKVSRNEPFSPQPGVKYKAVSAGYYNTCGILLDTDELRCWGNNFDDFLGAGISESLVPVTIDPGVAFQSVVQKGYGLCAIVKGTGQLKCLGQNYNGQLGDGTTVSRSEFVVIDPGVAYKKIVLGDYTNHVCGLVQSNGELRCWGGSNRATGNGSSEVANRPEPINIGTRYKDISAGSYHTCAIRESDDEVFCFGSESFANSQYGQAGHNRMDQGKRYSSIASGTSMACGVLSTSGHIRCWGSNYYELSLGRGGPAAFAEVVHDSGTYKSISVSGKKACGIQTDGSLFCWGDGDWMNSYQASPRYFPVEVDSGTSYEMIATGPMHACGIVQDTGVLKCWGSNEDGQLGLSMNTVFSRSTPTVIDAGVAYSYISVGQQSSCGIVKDTGLLKCWGANPLGGGLGDDTTLTRDQPTPVYGDREYTSVSVGASHTCAIEKDSKDLYCWGSNIFRQIGNNSTVDVLRPTLINAGIDYDSVYAGYSHTCGIRSDRSLYCWGRNAGGQLGDSTTTNRAIPRLVVGGNRFTSISVRDLSTCGLVEGTGQMMCWGSLQGEEYRNLFSTNQLSPVVITGATELASLSWSTAAGENGGFYCGITKDTNNLLCYGNSLSAQVGKGEEKYLAFPLNIRAPTE